MSTIDPDQRAAIAAAHRHARAPDPGELDWGDDSVAGRAYAALKREPVLFVTYGYLALSTLGLWSSWWFYRGFDFNVLQYMQGGDFLVAGVRHPAYALLLAIAVAYALLLSWPERWRRRHPDRYARIAHRWWARLAFPKRRGWWSMKLRPATTMALGITVMMLASVASYSVGLSDAVIEGHGRSVDRVRLHMAGARQPLGEARLLGTTQGFVLVYWPAARRVDAVPVESVERIETLPRVRSRHLRDRVLGR